jgi:hypothetical protein
LVNLPPISQLSEVEVDAVLLAEANEIFQLRRKGWSHYEIGMKLGKSVEAIKKTESECRDRLLPVVENQRAMLVAQIDEVLKNAWLIVAGAYEYSEKIAAMNTIVKAVATKAKILGLEANGPSTVNNNTLINMGPNEAKMRMEIMAKRMLKEQSANS